MKLTDIEIECLSVAAEDWESYALIMNVVARTFGEALDKEKLDVTLRALQAKGLLDFYVYDVAKALYKKIGPEDTTVPLDAIYFMASPEGVLLRAKSVED